MTQKSIIQEVEMAVRPVRPELDEILDLQSFRPDYQQFPARVTLREQGRLPQSEVLKTSNSKEALQFELATLEKLSECGLPVPKVLSRVFTLECSGSTVWAVLLEEINGSPPEWLGLNDLSKADLTCRLVASGIRRLHGLTDELLRLDTRSLLPRRELIDEYRLVRSSSSPWLREPLVSKALDLLEVELPKVVLPLVFSNGDYNPLNFIVRDREIVGWIDFEHACFEDPYIGLAKFLLWSDDEWGWGAGAKSGFVERFLFQENVRPDHFYCRVLLRAIYYVHLKPIGDRPQHILSIIREYSTKLELMNGDTYLTLIST